MTEDVYEPLARYRDEFRERFATLAREKFKELAKRSGVNVGANRALVAEIKKLEREADMHGCCILPAKPLFDPDDAPRAAGREQRTERHGHGD